MTSSTIILALAALFVIILLVLHLVHSRRIATLTAEIDARARSQYQRWRQQDYHSVALEQSSLARKEALAEFHQWKIDQEAIIRQDAITRSRATIVGKVTEHLVPHMPVFPYNPKDARFIGSPIDLVVFDGCDEGEIREVIFLEIKTGTSVLSGRQRQIRDAVEEGRVSWRVLKL